MSNYKPTDMPQSQEHLRYYQCFVTRPYGDDEGNPYCSFREERIVQNVNGKQTEPRGEVGTSISDANEETLFQELNPGTLEPTGNVMTYGKLLQWIDSLYIHLAEERDMLL